MPSWRRWTVWSRDVVAGLPRRLGAGPLRLGTLLEQIARLPREVLTPYWLSGFGLTSREVDVLRLIARGRSNKQIAAKLSLTVRTIEFHLSGVYRKLGISGRRELRAVLF